MADYGGDPIITPAAPGADSYGGDRIVVPAAVTNGRARAWAKAHPNEPDSNNPYLPGYGIPSAGHLVRDVIDRRTQAQHGLARGLDSFFSLPSNPLEYGRDALSAVTGGALPGRTQDLVMGVVGAIPGVPELAGVADTFFGRPVEAGSIALSDATQGATPRVPAQYTGNIVSAVAPIFGQAGAEARIAAAARGAGQTVPAFEAAQTQARASANASAARVAAETRAAQPPSRLAQAVEPFTAAVSETAAREQAGRRVSGLPDTSGDAADVGAALRAQHATMDAETQAAVDAARARSQASQEAIGGTATPDATGAAIRTAVQAAEKAGRQRTGEMYRALGLDDVGVTANMRTSKAAAIDIPAGEASTARPPQGEEAAIFSTAANLPDVAPVRDLLGLRERIGAELRAQRAPGGDANAIRRLSQLQSAIDHNLDVTLADRVASEHAAVAAGQLDPNAALAAKFQRIVDGWQEERITARTGTGWSDPADTGIGTGGLSGAGGTAVPAGGRSRSAAGNTSVSPTAAEVARAEADLGALYGRQAGGIFGEIQKLGGIKVRDEHGNPLAGPDVLGILADTKVPGVINNRNGLSPDAIAQALADRGVFGPRVDDPAAAFEAALTRSARRESSATEAAYREQLSADLRAAGVAAFDRQNVAAAKLAAYRAEVSALRAEASRLGIRDAEAMSLEDLRGDVAERRAIQGDAEAAPLSEAEAEFDRLSAPRREQPTVSPEVVPRLREANATYKAERRTFGAAPVDDILARDKNGGFVALNGEIPPAVVRPGPGGFERVTAVLKATGDKGLSLVEDAFAQSLRRAAQRPDGTIDPTAHAKWLKANSEGLRALPAAVRARLAEVGDAERALNEAVGNRKAALEAANRGVLGKLLGAEGPEEIAKVITGLFNKENSPAEVRRLLAQLKGNPQAIEGVRQAVRDHLAQFVADGKGAALQQFVRRNSGALRLLFSPEQMEGLHGLSAALKAGPKARNPIMLDLVAATLGGHFGGVEGFGASSTITHIVQILRNRGIERVDQLVKEAIADPEFGRTLRVPAPAHRAGTTAQEAGLVVRAKAIERALTRSAVIGAGTASQMQRDPQ